jgi:selenocysteine lyase/cysteine desulfurase
LAAITSSLDLQEGDQLITGELDFPTVAHGFHAQAKFGVETTVVTSEDRVMVTPEQFERAMSRRTRLVATSRVYFTSGYIQDVKAICDAAHNVGALAFVDDYQATGQIPIDVQEVGADVLVSGGLKWLLGGPGITYMYVRRDLISGLEPSIAGWFGHRDQFAFNPHEMVYKETAGRFETGTPSVSAIYAGTEGLRIVNDIGADAIRQRTSELTSRLVSSLRERGFKLRVPPDDEHHASITMIEMDDPGPVVDGLAERDIIADFRPGALRASPYFYNTPDDIDTFVDALTEITGESS